MNSRVERLVQGVTKQGVVQRFRKRQDLIFYYWTYCIPSVSLVGSQADEFDIWSGRLLIIAGAVVFIEAIGVPYGESLPELPLSWVLTSIPFGIGFVLAPFILFRSYQYLVDQTPTSVAVGVGLVAALPVGSIGLVSWGGLALAGTPIPDLSVLPVSVDTVFQTLIASFVVGVATFGLAFLRYERTRLLGGSLLTFALAWAVPLSAVKLSGMYPGWLANLLAVSVAVTMIAIGYCFPLPEQKRISESSTAS